MSSWTRTRSELGNEIRANGTDSPRAQRLRAQLKAERAKEYLERLVSDWPPLTPGQLASLAGTALSIMRAGFSQIRHGNRGGAAPLLGPWSAHQPGEL